MKESMRDYQEELDGCETECLQEQSNDYLANGIQCSQDSDSAALLTGYITRIQQGNPPELLDSPS